MRCDNTPFANTKGSALWQEQAPATPADIGIASSATAWRSFNDEIRMSNAFPRYDEITRLVYQPWPGLLPVMTNQPVRLPALPGVTYGRQTFSKLLLLALGFFLLFRVVCLLFRAGTRAGTAQQRDKERQNQK